MWPRMTCVAVWLAVVAVVCGLASGSSGCSNQNTCPSCIQTTNCMWCGRPGNFVGEDGLSLSRCMQHTDNVPSKWREACGASDVHEPGYLSEDGKSEECSFHGTYQCGECLCDSGYMGSQCECEASSLWGGGGNLSDSNCRQNSSSSVCSGRGTCTCGHCMCSERKNPTEIIGGAFCECTNFLCDHYNGQICGGPDHGECMCNKCVCKPGWTGDICMCEDSRNNCINPESGEECSGNGWCECNECHCFETEDGRYYGKYCEDCPTCRGKCVQYKSCVQCQVFGTGELTPEECSVRCTLFNSTVVNIVAPEEEYSERVCHFFDEDDCRFKFVYGYHGDNVPVVRVQTTRECPPPVRPQHGPVNNKQTTAGKFLFKCRSNSTSKTNPGPPPHDDSAQQSPVDI